MGKLVRVKPQKEKKRQGQLVPLADSTQTTPSRSFTTTPITPVQDVQPVRRFSSAGSFAPIQPTTTRTQEENTVYKAITAKPLKHTAPNYAASNYLKSAAAGVGAAFTQTAGLASSIFTPDLTPQAEQQQLRRSVEARNQMRAAGMDTTELDQSIQRTRDRINAMGAAARRGTDTQSNLIQRTLYSTSDTLAKRQAAYRQEAHKETAPILQPITDFVADMAPFLAMNSVPVVGQAAATGYLVGQSTGEARRAGMSNRAQATLGAASILSMGVAGKVGQAVASPTVTRWFARNGLGPRWMQVLEQAAVSGAATGTARQLSAGAVKAAGGVYREQVERAQTNIAELERARKQNHGKWDGWDQAAFESAVQANQQVIDSGGVNLGGALGSILFETLWALGGTALSYKLNPSRYEWSEALTTYVETGEEGEFAPGRSAYFQDVNTPEEAARKLRWYARQYHTDAHSNNPYAEVAMREINSEYNRLKPWMRRMNAAQAQTVVDVWEKASTGTVTQQEAAAAQSAASAIVNAAQTSGDVAAVQVAQSVLAPVMDDIARAVVTTPPPMPAYSPYQAAPAQAVSFEQWRQMNPQKVQQAEAAAQEELAAVVPAKGKMPSQEEVIRILSRGQRVPVEQIEMSTIESQHEQGIEYTMDANGQVAQVVPENHIDNRTFESVGDRRVPAFMFDFPQLQPYFREAADHLALELSQSQPGGQTATGYNDRTGLPFSYRTKRDASPRIADLLDNAGLSYNDISGALDAIKNNHGQENTAAAKRVEIVLDDMLSNGYWTSEGYVQPNQQYIRAKADLPKAEISRNSAKTETGKTPEPVALQQVQPTPEQPVRAGDGQGMDKRVDEMIRLAEATWAASEESLKRPFYVNTFGGKDFFVFDARTGHFYHEEGKPAPSYKRRSAAERLAERLNDELNAAQDDKPAQEETVAQAPEPEYTADNGGQLATPPTLTAKTPEGRDLEWRLGPGMLDTVDRGPFRYAVRQYGDHWYATVTRMPDQGGRISEAPQRLFSGNYPTRDEAAAELAAVAENNKLLPALAEGEVNHDGRGEETQTGGAELVLAGEGENPQGVGESPRGKAETGGGTGGPPISRGGGQTDERAGSPPAQSGRGDERSIVDETGTGRGDGLGGHPGGDDRQVRGDGVRGLGRVDDGEPVRGPAVLRAGTGGVEGDVDAVRVPSNGGREPDRQEPNERVGVVQSGRGGDAGNREHERPVAGTARSGGDSKGNVQELSGGGSVTETPEETRAREVKQKTETAEAPKGRDFTFPEGGLKLPSGEKARYKGNVEAIKTLKAIQAEGRPATQEEQEILSRYVGWGGLSNAFSAKDAKWAKENKELKEILSPEEYDAAFQSTQNAHYTSQEVIQAMYAGLEKWGFHGGRVLEPSAGVGNFNGAMPASLRQGTKWTMIELDNLTGGILSALYPNADVRVMGFEQALLPNDYFDAAISNVPFGNKPVFDKEYPKNLRNSIHNYFFVKSLDKVRPGGVVAFITSSFTMDSDTNSIRRHIMSKADLVGAIRLPNTAFKSNAGTEVVTDILFLKKREPNTPYSGQPFLELAYQGKTRQTQFYGNEYFRDHPEMVLGTPSRKNGMYGADSLTFDPLDTKTPLGKQIEEAMSRMDVTIDYPKRSTPEEARKAVKQVERKGKVGSVVKKDGKLYKRNAEGNLDPLELKAREEERLSAAVSIRDAARALLNFQLDGADKKTIANSRKGLNALYDDFVKKYGFLNKQGNRTLIKKDVDAPFIFSLENWDKDTKTATKADIFTKDTVSKRVTVTHTDTIEDGLAVCLNQIGRIDLSEIAALTGQSGNDVRNRLLENGLAFLDRDGGLVQPAEYLSGNVRAKLKEAEALAQGNPEYQRNVDALKKVIPKDVEPEDIRANVGAAWIPPSFYGQFANELLQQTGITVRYEPSIGKYYIDERFGGSNYGPLATQTWGTKDKPFGKIFEAMLNHGSLNVTREAEGGGRVLDQVATQGVRQKKEEIQTAFSDWLWKDDARREELKRLYNDVNNNLALPHYDGRNITVNGANPAFELRDFQRDTVARAVYGPGNILIDHCTGAGKTYTMASIVMKMRELGTARKPVMVFPKNILPQQAGEFLKFYPAAKILYPGKDEFTTQTRKEFINRAANGDYDAIMLSNEQFEKIVLSEDQQRQFYQAQIDILNAAIERADKIRGKDSAVKDIARQRDTLTAKLEELNSLSRDEDNLSFEEIGIDALLVDEAHYYRRLLYSTKLGQIGGMGDKTGSKRSLDMLQKTGYLGKSGINKVVYATATPVMNSIVELYNMMRYLVPETLDAQGLTNLDAWIDEFAEVSPVTQPKVAGKGFQTKDYLTRFTNVPELQSLYRSFADVIRELPSSVKVPKMKTGKRIMVECEPSDFQSAFLDEMGERANRMKGGFRHEKGEDNMLALYTDGMKVALSQKLIDPSLPLEPNGKIAACADKIEEIWKETAKDKGTQIVFCDLGTPGKKTGKKDDNADADAAPEDSAAVTIYDDLKNLLVGKGIPEKEIAFIHTANTDDKKKEIFKAVNDGRVRVLIGSTGKMGVGMNAQARVAALHHLNPPHLPGDIEQREGRALRQGNMYDEVSVFVYTTKRSIDARMWHNLSRKAEAIDQLRRGDSMAREMEGESEFAVSAAEIAAITSGDPLLLEQYNVNQTITELENRQRAHMRQVLDAQKQIREAQAGIVRDTEAVEHFKADIAARQDTKGEKFSITIGGKSYAERKAGGEALLSAAAKRMKDKNNTDFAEIGSFAGFPLLADNRGNLVLRGQSSYNTAVNFNSAVGSIQSLEALPRKMESMLKATENRLKANKAAIPELQKTVEKPFPKAKELEQARLRNAQIMDEMKRQANGQQPAAPEPEQAETPAPTEPVHQSRDRSAFPSRPERWTADRVGDTDKKALRPQEIIDKYRRKWGRNVTVGHIRGAGVRGQYNEQDKGVRLRIAGDIPTYSHEMGHSISHKYNLTGPDMPETVRQEMVKNLDPDFAAQYKDEQLPEEGMAEFFRRFNQNSAMAAADYPETYQYVMSSVDGRDLEMILAMADDCNAAYAADASEASGSIRLSEKGPYDTRNTAEKLTDFFDAAKQTLYDDLYSVEKASRQMGSNVYKEFRNAKYAAARAYYILGGGDIFGIDGEWAATGLKAALNGLNLKDAKEYMDFGEFLKARHAPSWFALNRRVYGNDRLDNKTYADRLRDTLGEKKSAFWDASDGVYEWNHNIWVEYGVKSGLMSEEQLAENEKKFPFYVPLQRVMDKKSAGTGAKQGFVNLSSPMKRGKGSGRDTYHPLDSLMRNAANLIQLGIHNKAMLDFVDAAKEANLGAEWIEKIPPSMVPKLVNISGMKADVKNKVLESDLDESAKETLYEILDEQADMMQYFGVGKPYGNIVTVRRNGKLEWYKVNHDLLLKAFENVGNTSAPGNPLLKLLVNAASLTTSLKTSKDVVWSITRNAPKDLQEAIYYSTPKDAAKLIPNMIRSWADSLKDVAGSKSVDPVHLQFMAMGGGWTGAYAGSPTMPRTMRRKLAGYRHENPVIDVISAPLEALNAASEAIERGPREADFRIHLERGETPHEAFRHAMELTTDYKMGSNLSRSVSYALPFTNPALQSTVKKGKYYTAADADKGERLKTARDRFLFMAAANLLVSGAFWAINHANEERRKNYNRLSTYTKNSFYLVPDTKNGKETGTFTLIPKGRANAVFGSLVERIMEKYLDKNPHAFDGFLTYAAETELPSIAADVATGNISDVLGSVNFFGTGYYLAKNENFLGQPIESTTMRNNYTPGNRFTGRTSLFAKEVGGALNISPLQIDFFGEQTFGGYYKYMRALAPVDPKYRDLTLGVKNSFKKDSLYSTDIPNRLYTQSEKSENTLKDDPDNVRKKAEHNLDSAMASFYTRYNRLSKEKEETDKARELRELVLTMADDYLRVRDGGDWMNTQKAVFDVCQKAGTTANLLPTAREPVVRDENKEDHTLTAAQYYDYQTNYNAIFWDTVANVLPSAKTDEEREAVVKAAEDAAGVKAKNNVLIRLGKPTTKDFKKYEEMDLYSIPLETYVSAKAAAAGIEALTDRKGNNITNSQNAQIAEAVYDMDLNLPDTNIKKLIELCLPNEGKTVLGWNETQLRRELRQMRRQAGVK